MKYELSIKEMVFIITVVVVTMIILMRLEYIGVDLSALINIPDSAEDILVSSAGAMSGTIN